MKKYVAKALVLFLVIIASICVLPNSSYAASVTYYQTAESNVILRTGPASSYKNNTKTIATKGTVVKVVGKTTNSSGNVWYQLSDGYWVFSERVTRHYHYYVGGICSSAGCGYEYPLSYTSSSMTVGVTNTAGAKAWSRPYSNNSNHITTYGYGTQLSVVSYTTNVNSSGNPDNVWYKLSNGYWVYSGNVAQIFTVSYSANGGSGAPSAQKFYSGSSVTVSSTKPTRVGYIFKGWSTSSGSSTVSYSAGSKYSSKKNITLYAVWSKCGHSTYSGGICTTCKYEYPLTVTSTSGTFIVTNSSGAKAWSRPYSNNSTHLRTHAKDTALSVIAKTTNISSNGKADNVWYKLSDGSWVYSGNVTQRFSVKYNANGGSGAPSTQYFLSGKSVTISSTKPTRSTYIFKGWATSSGSSTVAYKGGNTYSSKKSITLYAVWSKCSHSKYSGGICTTCKYEYPLTVTSTSGTFVATNSSGAKAWSRPYSNNSTHLKTYAKDTALSVVAKTTNIGSNGKAYNVWYKLSDGSWVYSGNIAQRFSVKYNANGGKTVPSTQYFLSGKSVTISSTKPTRVGYTFKGWSTSSSSSSVAYKGGNKYSSKKSITLYAVWSKCSHSKYSGGICTTCKYEYPLTVTSVSGTFVVTNSSGAKAWSRPYSNNSTHLKTYAKDTKLSVVAKTTNIGSNGKAYNVWYKLSDGSWVYSGNIAQRYSVKYNANGGKGAPSTQYFLSGKSATISKTKPTRVGYVFKGWGTSSSSLSAKYSGGTKYSTKKNITLYAVWGKCNHSKYLGGICTTCNYEYSLKQTSVSGTFVVTNDNGASAWSRPYSNNSKKLKIYNKDAKLTVVAKVKNISSTGKSANVWYKLSDGSWVYSGNITQRYSVKYNANSGKGAPSTQYFLDGKSTTISKTKPTRVGYTFKGWATSKSSTKVSYKSGAKYSDDKNLTLYAVWEKCTHKYNNLGVCTTCKYAHKPTLDTAAAGSYVVIEKNGAIIKDAPYGAGKTIKTAKKGEVLTVVAKGKNAYKNTWYKLDSGNWVYSERIKPGYKVTYKANGGTNAPASTGFESGKLVVSSKVPTRTDYVFLGWATSSKATKATYSTGDTYSVKKNITLYAVWSKCTHNYTNNYGICKNCKTDYPLTVKSSSKTVYSVNNKNGTAIYKRPYSKSSEKVKSLSNKKYVLVVGSATNANGETWCKLKDGNWIKKSEIKKHDTYSTIDSIPYRYASIMIGDNADGGLLMVEIINDVKYLYFFDDDKSFFLESKAAFTSTSKNTQLTKVNTELSKAVNDRTSIQKNFVYNTKTTKKIKSLSSNCDYENSTTHNHIIWEISTLTAKAGITGSDGVYVRCQNDAKTAYIEYCTHVNAIEYRWSKPSSIYPEFTLSTTPYAEDGEAVGWFTDFELVGKGLKEQKFAIKDYVDLFSCAVKGVASVGKFVVAPTPTSAFNVLKENWKFYSNTESYLKSTDYTSGGKNGLTYVNKETNTAYKTYKISVASPINLRSAKDYLEAHLYLYELNKNQSITIELKIK